MNDNIYSHRYYALIRALREWPTLPDSKTLHYLGEASRDPKGADDSRRGKAMQAELGLEKIPPVAECEWGAGLWDRITNGAWRDDKTREKT